MYVHWIWNCLRVYKCDSFVVLLMPCAFHVVFDCTALPLFGVGVGVDVDGTSGKVY